MAKMSFLKLVRNVKGITLYQLSDKTKKILNVSHVLFSRVENCSYRASPIMQKELEKILDIDKESLFTKEGFARPITNKEIERLRRFFLKKKKTKELLKPTSKKKRRKKE